MATTLPSYQNLYDGLKTLDPVTGAVPKSRMSDPTQVRDMVTRAIRYDMNYRDWKRSRLKGLVDGNPPYSHSALVAAGRGDECNVNWRIAKYFLSLAKGMLYDVFSEAETYATVTMDEQKIMEAAAKEDDFGGMSPDQVTTMGNVVTEEFDRLQRGDPDWDFTNQQSQGQCVLYGCGPIVFEDELDWRPWSFESRTLLVPEWARSNTNKWEWCALIVEYSPDKLYQHIMNPSAAQQRGWDVAATRRAIMGAHPLTRTGVMYQNWSWHQDLLKNGTYYYADQSKLVRCAHFYFREFPDEGEENGRITECMIDLDGLNASEQGRVQFLFNKHKRYGNWRECIHPMYWDHDVNGYHHSVTGLGVEMYAALEYENRLLCRLADDAFAPKLFFKPTTASERERMSIAQVGRYAILPAALDMVQQHVQPFLQDGIAMSREVQSLVSSNLSQFRSNALTKQQGNPVTARQIDYEASEQAKMGKTQLSRIYEQYDWVYAEKYRRATNPQLTAAVRGGKEAIEFQKRCEKRGVPTKALRMTNSIMATRVVGQGSAFMRQQALEFLMGLASMLPETGRTNLVKQVIASRAGQSKVAEFYPEPTQDISMAEQTAEATEQVGLMKQGIPPVPVPTQNPMIYASVFLNAAQSAMQGVQQGGADPHEAVAFLDLALPAVVRHVQRMAGDKTRASQVKNIMQGVQEIAQFSKQVKDALQQQAAEQQRAQQELQQTQAGMSPETQVGLAKVQAKHQVDLMKTQGNLQLHAARQQAEIALKAHAQDANIALQGRQHLVDTTLEDADTAAGIHRANAETAAAIHRKRMEVAMKPTNGKKAS